MAPFECPRTHEARVAAGWIFRGDSNCKTKECGAHISWYKLPNGQIMPVDYITQSPHWLSCAGADNHRKKKPPKPQPPVDPQGNLFGREPGEEG